MEKTVKSLFNDKILNDLKKQSGIKTELKLLRGFENLVYEFEQDGRQYIYRVAHTGRRTREDIRGELEFLNFLYENGVRVSRPVFFREEYEIAEEKIFTGVIFEKSTGSKPNKETFTGEIIRKVGEETGKMHRLTNQFRPSDEKFKRQTWERDHNLLSENFGEEEKDLREKWNKNFFEIQQIPVSDEYSGLIHTDIHGGNFFVNDDKREITIFDFDDCCYYHFVNDLAISTYYFVMMEKTKKEKTEKAKYFMNEYLEGYIKQFTLPKDWFKYIPLMMKQREFVVYLVLKRTMDEEWLKGDGKEFMAEYLFNLRNDIPYIDKTEIV